MYNKLAIIFSIFLMSCNPDIQYINYNSINGLWHKDSVNIVSIDTIEHKLADKYGKFLGRKRINIVDNSLLHKENISLDNEKKYFVSIEHAMRVINKVGGLELLEGVVDVGFKIEKAK